MPERAPTVTVKPINDEVPAVKPLRVIAPGSEVKCGNETAKVISFTLREGLFAYQVSWWIGNERRTESVSGCELKATAETKYLLITSE